MLFSSGVVMLLTMTVVESAIYPLNGLVIASSSAVVPMKDMPMFSYEDSPSWFGKSMPFISITGTVKGSEGASDSQKVLRAFLGFSVEPLRIATLPDVLASCSSDVGDISKEFPGHSLDFVEGNSNKVDISFNVNRTGWYMIVIANCMQNELQLDVDIAYRNPYGFLNGWAFGSLPMDGILSLSYFILGLYYFYKCLRNRQHILRLQYAILLVILMGLIERFTWFITYLEMNESGGKTCCPVRSDITFSLALAVFKRSSSALLLLAVCLGYGVVKPTLDRYTSAGILFLGCFYTFASLNLDLAKVADISKHGKQTNPEVFSALLVSICDVVIVFWIYTAMSDIQKELSESQQVVKLGMYQTLARALAVWAFVWLVFTILEVMVSQAKVDVQWRYWFLLVSFWDIFYLGILVQICYLWAPSELSSQYAYSHQLPTSEDLNEFDQIGLELQGPDTAAEFVIGDDDDDMEEDDELSLEFDEDEDEESPKN